MTGAVDLALWEITSGVLNGLRSRMRVSGRSQSATMQLEIGDCAGTRMLVARPGQDRHLPPGSRLASLYTTHRPKRLIGVAAGAGEGADHVLLTNKREAARHAAGWPEELFAAAEQQGAPLEVLLLTAPAPVLDLLSARTPIARRFGRLVGGLLKSGARSRSAALAEERDRFLDRVAETVLSIATEGDR